jgi:hypothetical protein
MAGVSDAWVGVNDGPDDVAWLDQTRLPLSGMVRGELQLLINVDSKAP